MTEREPLASMPPAEFAAWCAYHQALLEDFCSFAQEYVLRRAARGTNTATDARYLHFLQEARDLIAGLAELRQVAERPADRQDQFFEEGYSYD